MFYNFEAFRKYAENKVYVSMLEYMYVKRPEVEKEIKERYWYFECIPTYPKCEEPCCEYIGNCKCTLPSFNNWKPDIISHYCSVHAVENGYCPGCGNYYEGTSEFHYNGGWCDNCYYEICQQMADEREEAEELGCVNHPGALCHE